MLILRSQGFLLQMVSGISGANFAGKNTCVGPSGEFAGREASERNSHISPKEIARGTLYYAGGEGRSLGGLGVTAYLRGKP